MPARLCSLALAFLLVLSGLAAAWSGWQPAVAAPLETTVGARNGRHQFNVVASPSFVVWEDRAAFIPPAPGQVVTDAIAGSSDIFGLDISTNRPITVTDAKGDQQGPAISGSLVVWQDNGHSCTGCERDIRGKDLATGTEFAIAVGPADQASPTIDGRTVVWIEGDAGRVRLLSRTLDRPATTELAIVTDPMATITAPAISADLIVWGQQYHGKHLTIFAYERGSGRKSVIDNSGYATPNYAVSGTRVVWADPGLWLTDVAAGTIERLSRWRAIAPQVEGDVVVWTSSIGGRPPSILGLTLQDKRPLVLVDSPSEKRAPRLMGGKLWWHTEEQGQIRLRSTPLDQALVHGRPPLQGGGMPTGTPPPTMRPIITATAAPSPAATTATPAAAMAMSDAGANTLRAASHGRPVKKGIHAATYKGWDDPAAWQTIAQSLDGGAPYYEAHAPYFGSVVVLYSDLLNVPNLAVHMQRLVYQSVQVIVRIDPTSKPTLAEGPASVVNRVMDVVNRWPWVPHIQIDNEPNLDGDTEWPTRCQPSCTWINRTGAQESASYNNSFEVGRYDAINRFYLDVYYRIQDIAAGDARVRSITFWSPPMVDIFSPVGGQTMYDPLASMLYAYSNPAHTARGGMAYHTYPAPNWDAHLPYVGPPRIYNNSWVYDFPGWLRDEVDNRVKRSLITEFGWNPGQMHRCSYSQSTIWWPEPDGRVIDPGPPVPSPSGLPSYANRGLNCSAMDGLAHAFQDDIYWFLQDQLHGAEVLAVWLVAGNEHRSNGVVGGDRHLWLDAYRNSNP
jgi:hypothetical protein